MPPSQYESGTGLKKGTAIKSRDLQLRELNFCNATINNSTVRKFVVRNNSGIKAVFCIHSKNYEPVQYLNNEATVEPPRNESSKQSLGEASEVSRASKATKVVRLAASTRSKSIGRKKAHALRHPILTAAHEQEKKFTSAIGETYTATKRLAEEQAFYLQNNKGLAMVCQPCKGELAPHSEMVVTVTLYNNTCGRYEDTIVSEVKGLDKVEIPVSIDIKGSPIAIPSDQVGVYFNEDPPAVVMKASVQNAGKVAKSFKIRNAGVQDVAIDWKVFDLGARAEAAHADLFNLSFVRNEGNVAMPYSVDYDFVEPEESKNSLFTVTPKSTVIGAKQKATFEVTFDTSGDIGEYNALIQARPKLTKESVSGSDTNLGVIYLALRGEILKAHLVVDKKMQRDGKPHLQFEIWPNNDCGAPQLSKKIPLINESPADIALMLATTGPFSVVSTFTNAPPHPLAKETSQHVQTLFNLLPGTFVEAECKVLKPNPSNLSQWPLVGRMTKHGTLTLNYSNKTAENVVLEANFLRPHITIHIKDLGKNDLAEDEFDFGTVYIDKERAKEVVMYLKNESAAVAKWSLNHVTIQSKPVLGHKTITRLEKENKEKKDDESVFVFSASEVTGCLELVGSASRPVNRNRVGSSRTVGGCRRKR